MSDFDGSDFTDGLGAWLPIETAPKDRRILLGFSSPVFTGVSAIFGKWDTDEYAKKPRPFWYHDLNRLTGKNGARENAPALGRMRRRTGCHCPKPLHDWKRTLRVVGCRTAGSKRRVGIGATEKAPRHRLTGCAIYGVMK